MVGRTNLKVEFDVSLHAPAHVRHTVATWLAASSVGPVSRDLLLVVSELVTNVVQHARTAGDVHLTLRADGSSRIEVTDACATAPAMRPPTIDGGRGLRLVTQLSTQWGVVERADGKTVWAELPPSS